MMMKGKFCAAALLAAMLLFWGSCTKTELREEAGGTVSLTVVTSDTQTRAPSGDPADGGGIVVDGSGNPDLAIIIADSEGSLVAWYPSDFLTGLSMNVNYLSECTTEHDPSVNAMASTVRFTGIQRGNYTVYAFANKSGLSTSELTALRGCVSASGIDALQLSVESDQYPSFSGVMALSARASLFVNASGNGQVDVPLLRPVARVSMTFRNLTEEDISIYDCRVSIGAMNPERGYLVQNSPDLVPSYDRDLEFSSAGPLVFGDDPDLPGEYLRSTLPVRQVFPSVAPERLVGSRYLCTISFHVKKPDVTYDPDDPDTYDDVTFPDLPVHDSRSSDIQFLKRNQFLKIETRITKRAAEFDYSFNFDVMTWTEKENYLTFD